jgi:transglutaminase-like putative cysteine protease
MRSVSGFRLGLVLLATAAFAGAARARTVLDLWDAAYIQNGKAGYFRTTVEEVVQDGRKLLRTTLEMNLTLKRFSDTINLRAETGTEETLDGKVTGVFMRHYLGKQQQLLVTGTVVGRELHLTASGGGKQSNMSWKAPWDDRVVSLYRQQRIFQERKVKPGDAFDFKSFEPSVNLVVTTRVRVKGYEEVTMPGSKVKRRLLHVEARADEIRTPKGGGKFDRFQPPTLHYWLDQDRMPARSEMDMPGLGKIVAVRTTRSAALAAGPLASATDMGLSQVVRLNRRIPRPLDAKSAVYRITIKGDREAASAFAQDERQLVKNDRGETFDLHVQGCAGPESGKEGGKVGDEFLKSSYFITCGDSKVREHARKAVGSEKDPWKKALWIERWVRRHMKVTFDEELATAAHVARTLEGDCTEHAMLAAAMCRAVGVPSRTALGMIYADLPRKGPAMVFHMWTEVYVRGQWVPIDATLGRGYVGADHIKVSDQSWHDTRSLTPLLPFVRVVGKVAIEVVRVNER